MESVYNKKYYSPEARLSRWKKTKRFFNPRCPATAHSRNRITGCLREFWMVKPPIVSFGAMIALLPLPLLVEGQEAKCAYVLGVMAFMWLTEAVPIAVTALLPVIMFPMAGILTAKDVGHSYLSNTSLLFIGGLIVAIAVEESNLHKRIALNVLRLVGSDPKWIMLGLMLPTWFLSMWISNTATASMMIPIVEAVLEQIKTAKEDLETDLPNSGPSVTGAESQKSADDTIVTMETMLNGDKLSPRKPKRENSVGKVSWALGPKNGDDTASNKDNLNGDSITNAVEPNGDAIQSPDSYIDEMGPESPSKVGLLQPKFKDMKAQYAREVSKTSSTWSEDADPEYVKLCKGLSLCIAYAGNTGGIATLTGTPPNLVLKGQADMFFNKYGAHDAGEYNLTFVGWMVMAFPLSLLLLILVWLWLVLLFLRGNCCKKDHKQMNAVKKVIKTELEAMGSITFVEIITSVLFILLVFLWISRDPRFVTGWSVIFKDSYVSDATAAVMVAVMFFILPKEKPNLFCWKYKPVQGLMSVPSYEPLLSWSTVQAKLPWGIIVLLGGGFALAKACKYSGLSTWVGVKLATFDSLDPWLLNFIICIIVAMATEVTSNTATATLLMPMMAELSLKLKVNPLYLMSSAALATSFAFMMPVATPPNAIVFSHGRLSIPDMASAGALVNVIAVVVLTLAVNTWGDAFFSFSTMPDIFVNGTIPETSD